MEELEIQLLKQKFMNYRANTVNDTDSTKQHIINATKDNEQKSWQEQINDF